MKQMIEAKEQKLVDIFSNKYAFTIPMYQRPYSWDRENVVALFDDVLSAMQEDAESPYFLGSTVVIKQLNEPDAEVIDGQQRLTSLCLLFAALRNHLGTDSALVENRLFEKANKYEKTQDRFRLTVRNKERDFFTNEILQQTDWSNLRTGDWGSLTDVQSRMRINALTLEDLVVKLSNEERDALAGYLTMNVYLVIVSTPDDRSAFRIFSVLNDRGMPLTAADILKADIVGQVPEANDQQKLYNQRWEDVEEDLGAQKLDLLFSHIRLIHLKKRTKLSVLEAFRKHIDPGQRPCDFIDNELIPYSDAFSSIVYCDYEATQDAEIINRFLGYLARLQETEWQAPAMLYIAKQGNYPAKVLSFLKELERLATVMSLTAYTPNQRSIRYGDLLKQMKSDIESPAFSAMELSDKDISRMLEILNGEVYRLAKYKRILILLRLDEALSEQGATYDARYRTIEHILPQNPAQNSEWLEWWPDHEMREDNVHRLGNLALLDQKQNSSAGNYEWNKKKTAYFYGKSGSSPFIITNELRELESWKPVQFEERQARYVQKLCEVWDLSSED